MNQSTIIIGKISSGKSTLAKSIQELVPNTQIASFGAYLKSYCEERDLIFDREFLQNLGQKFIDENPEKFLKQVVDFNLPDENSIIIFEGIRHASIFNAIENQFPILVSIYLDMSAEIRYEWYRKRNREIDKEMSWKEFLNRNNHKVELDIESLKPRCNLVLNQSNLSENLRRVRQYISRRA